jgi:hypothetical protein
LLGPRGLDGHRNNGLPQSTIIFAIDYIIITDTPMVQGQVQSCHETRIAETQETPPVDRKGAFEVLKGMVVCFSLALIVFSRVHPVFASPLSITLVR